MLSGTAKVKRKLREIRILPRGHRSRWNDICFLCTVTIILFLFSMSLTGNKDKHPMKPKHQDTQKVSKQTNGGNSISIDKLKLQHTFRTSGIPRKGKKPLVSMKTKVSAKSKLRRTKNTDSIQNYVSMPRVHFRYIINQKDICKKAKNLLLLIYVFSAPGMSQERNVIRNTWGNYHLGSLKGTRLVFFLGRSLNSKIQSNIAKESKKYKDIVQLDLIDTYKNGTYKGFMAWQWVKEECSTSQFFLKADTDAFIHVPNLLPLLRNAYKKQKKFIGGKLLNNLRVIRPGQKTSGKDKRNLVDKKEYPSNIFPPYLQGSAYVMSREAWADLFKASVRVPLWRMEDVYFTGILPEAINTVQHVQLKHLWANTKEELKTKLQSKPKTAAFATLKSSRDIKEMWTIVTKSLSMKKS